MLDDTIAEKVSKNKDKLFFTWPPFPSYCIIQPHSYL